MSHIQKLEVKRDLVSQQESALARQLELHKKMLSLVKVAADKTKKMKEILTTQTRIMELKREIKSIVEDLEAAKKEDNASVFVSTAKRPVFRGVMSAGGGGSRSLDRRTTVLKVVGFEEGTSVDALHEHFAALGAVTSVTIKDCGDGEEEVAPSALIHFATRIDAERAKASDSKFNESALVFAWHQSPASPAPANPNDAVAADPSDVAMDGENLLVAEGNNGAGDSEKVDDDGEERVATDVERPPARDTGEEDEQMVDYDFDDEGDDDDDDARWR